MSLLCLWIRDWSIGEESFAELTTLLLEEAPRVVLEGRGVVWVDARGLDAGRLARTLIDRLSERGIGEVRVGVGAVPIVAEGAARFGGARLVEVPRGKEAATLSPFPLELLTQDEHLLGLLEGTGVKSCGELAALTAEAVEVRFGSEGARAWRLARGDDPRILFRPIPPERPVASADFIDYSVRDATRLVFTLNALLDQVCEALRARARRARSLTLTFTLSGGGRAQEVLRTARPTADRALWMRRLRTALERVRLADTISGVAIEVGSSEPASALQGDLFDRGFATASFVEEAVARLIDLYSGLFVRQRASGHPLAERRASWAALTPEGVAATRSEAERGAVGSGTPERLRSAMAANRAGAERGAIRPGTPARPTPAVAATQTDEDRGGPSLLELQLLSIPRPIRVRTRGRRDHFVPTRYLEGRQWHALTSAGPDRISGGHEEARPYAREYYRCVSDAGALLWIYRDAVEDRWYLHGWWD